MPSLQATPGRSVSWRRGSFAWSAPGRTRGAARTPCSSGCTTWTLRASLPELKERFEKSGGEVWDLPNDKLDAFVAWMAEAPIDSASRDQRLAFWLNAYDALVLKTVVDHYPIVRRSRDYPDRSIRQIPGAFERLPHDVIHQFVPLDLPRFINRFFDHWRPDLVLMVEADLWPNLILASAERGIPLILINDRVSFMRFLGAQGKAIRFIQALAFSQSGHRHRRMAK